MVVVNVTIVRLTTQITYEFKGNTQLNLSRNEKESLVSAIKYCYTHSLPIKLQIPCSMFNYVYTIGTVGFMNAENYPQRVSILFSYQNYLYMITGQGWGSPASMVFYLAKVWNS